jgi:Zn finger protein HypA/HybF involved in hydrogenase expression
VDSEAKAGYLLLLMAITAFCTSCQRTVYIEEDDTQVCPVCSTPLLEIVPAMDGPSDDNEPDHAGGAK